MPAAPLTLGCFTQAGGTWGEYQIYNAVTSGSGGFNIPAHDEETMAYYGTTNNIFTVTYSLSGNPVAIQTLTYVNGAASDNDLIQTVTISYL